MKRFLLLILTIVFLDGLYGSCNIDTLSIIPDTIEPRGSVTGSVFFSYKNDFSIEPQQKRGFAIERVYFGYKYDFSRDISARIIFDINHDPNLKSYFAYVKNAQLDWSIIKNLRLSAGMIALKQFDSQEKFWGLRYVMKPFAEQYNFGVYSDLGINLEFKVSNALYWNVFVLNGEGYKAIQDQDGTHKLGSSFLFKPNEEFTFKAYFDWFQGNDKHAPIDTSSITSINIFAGYKLNNQFSIGVEYNRLSNGQSYYKFAQGFDMSGWSVFGTLNITKKLNLFSRFDLLKSNYIEDISMNWNFDKDGYLILTGMQFSLEKNINFALNYRSWVPDNKAINTFHQLYLNMNFSF